MSDTPDYSAPRHELHDADAPPTGQDVWAAQEDARDAVEHATAVAGQLEHEQVAHVATTVARRESRRYGLVAAFFCALIAIGVSVLAVSLSERAAAAAAAADARSQATEQTVSVALAKLDEANKALTARGQAPVEAPPNPDPSEAIRAAVLAQVLAQLPPTPTAQQVADQLRSAVVNAVTDRATLAGLIAAYFAANAPPGPSQEAIQAAVNQAYAANPPRDGRDGESPPCLSEPTQCRGADGDKGERGDDGKPGPPPGSWSWPDPVVPNVTHSCTRSGGSDAEPTYSCT